MPKNQLKNLLNFSHCDSKDKILRHAEVVSTELMSNWEIVSPSGKRRFWGLEFYVFIPRIFEDQAVHKRREQLTNGCFYLHTKSKGTWKHPIFNRHGIDITCGTNLGSKEESIYGGILLRHLGGEGHRDGSGLALRSLVRGDQGFNSIKRGSPNNKWSESEKDFLGKVNEDRHIFDSDIYLQHAPLAEDIEIKSVKRIGIENTNFSEELLGFRRK